MIAMLPQRVAANRLMWSAIAQIFASSQAAVIS